MIFEIEPLKTTGKLILKDRMLNDSQIMLNHSQISIPHMKKIIIENFRCFTKFQLSSLKQLNIIVGDNNSGKTALLEAVSIVCKPNLEHLFWLVQQRIENLNLISSIKEEIDFLFNFIADNKTDSSRAKIAVYNHSAINEVIEFFIEKNYSSSKSELKECFALYALQEITQSKAQKKLKLTLKDGSPTLRNGNILNNILLQVIDNRHLSNKDFSELNFKIETLYRKIKSIPHIFINSTCQFQDIFLNQLETLKFEDRATWKNDALPFLQKIYPDLVGVEFGRNSRIIIETATGALPLSYMGDGFKKAFYLFLAVYCCKDGVLIIDELETGIHYENQQAVWQMLLSASKEFNVQLFISTHSYEMLEYLQKAIENQPQEDKTHWQEQLSLFSFVKLNKTPSSYYHDYDYFSELVKSKCELR